MILRTSGRLLALAAVAAGLGACGASDSDPGPGGVTVGEARALDEAAEMLDSRRLPDEAIPAGDAQDTAGAVPAPAAAPQGSPTP